MLPKNCEDNEASEAKKFKMPLLTAAEIEKHAEYPHVFWKLTPTKSGKLPVAVGRGGPINIAWEVHGHGPRLLVLVMGLGALHNNWQRQTRDFGHKQADDFSVLVFDNRGIGHSDKPLMRYSTSEMARDVIELVDHVGWSAERSLNIVGVSMGGMIALEMAMLIPSRIATLNLISTAAQLINTIGFMENLQQRASLFIPKSMDQMIIDARGRLFSKEFLDSLDELEYEVKPFPTAGDRFGAGELAKRTTPGLFTRPGFMCQAIAVGWHKKSKEQLRQLADNVGRDRIMVMHGTEDRMITVSHGETLADQLSRDGQEVKKIIWVGQGHVIPIEKRDEFHQILAEKVEEHFVS